MEGFIFGILLYLAVVRQRSTKTYQKVGFDDTAKNVFGNSMLRSNL